MYVCVHACVCVCVHAQELNQRERAIFEELIAEGVQETDEGLNDLHRFAWSTALLARELLQQQQQQQQGSSGYWNQRCRVQRCMICWAAAGASPSLYLLGQYRQVSELCAARVAGRRMWHAACCRDLLRWYKLDQRQNALARQLATATG